MKYDQLVKAYADRMSLNQKRILLGIKRFTPKFKPGEAPTYRIPSIPLTDALHDRVRELRKEVKEKVKRQ